MLRGVSKSRLGFRLIELTASPIGVIGAAKFFGEILYAVCQGL